jgi:hypothetical protein
MGPLDEVRYVGFCHWKRRFSKPERSYVYVVTHRGPVNEKNTQLNTWVHVYRIVDGSGAGRPVVYLEAVLNGSNIVHGLTKAHQLIARFGQPPGLVQDLRPFAADGEAA